MYATGDKKLFLTIPSAAKVIQPVLDVSEEFKAADLKVNFLLHSFQVEALPHLAVPKSNWKLRIDSKAMLQGSCWTSDFFCRSIA